MPKEAKEPMRKLSPLEKMGKIDHSGKKMGAGSNGAYKGATTKNTDSEKGPKNPIDRGPMKRKKK